MRLVYTLEVRDVEATEPATGLPIGTVYCPHPTSSVVYVSD